MIVDGGVVDVLSAPACASWSTAAAPDRAVGPQVGAVEGGGDSGQCAVLGLPHLGHGSEAKDTHSDGSRVRHAFWSCSYALWVVDESAEICLELLLDSQSGT